MAHYFNLEARLGEVADKYFELTQDASDNRAGEMRAVVRCQSVYRAAKIRERWHAVLHNTRLVQRCIRGWLARERCKCMRLDKQCRLNLLFFHHCASVVQKFFRGWWSRRHLHDYYGRKRYLETVEKRGEWTTDFLRREHAHRSNEAKVEEEDHMRQEFDNLAGELHHLVSTKTIAGVYNPPYNDTLPRAFDKPIEQHLRDSCRVRLPRSLRRPKSMRLISGPGGDATVPLPPSGYPAPQPPQDLPNRNALASRTASVGHLQKIQGPFRSRDQIEISNARAHNTYRTIQATAKYDVVEVDRRMQQKLSKLTRVSPLDFVAPGLPAQSAAPSSVNAAAPWRERAVQMRSDYTELPKIRDKPPFFTSMPRDKNFEDYQERDLLPHSKV